MNHTLTILGKVGREPEMRYTSSGVAVTSFSVATNYNWTNSQGEKVKETTWFQISTWNKQAEVAKQYLHKGDTVYIEGRITPDKETGGPRIWAKQDGTQGTSYEVRASKMVFVESKRDDSQPVARQEQAAHDIPVEDEIPF